MILLDVNVLVYAHRPDLPNSSGVLSWLKQALEDDEPVAVWDTILLSTYRVLTNPRFVREPDAPKRALRFLNEVREASVVVAPGPRHWQITTKLIEDSRATGNLVTDAAIAAVSIEHGCRLATFDQDFGRFKGLKWFEPIK